MELISDHFLEHTQVIQETYSLVNKTLIDITHIILKSLNQGGTIFWLGNGGSAADSQHFSAELVGRFKRNRKPLSSIALTTDTSVLTCIANDFGYEEIFSRQLEGLAHPNDIVIVFTTSGNSPNVLKALSVAKKLQLTSIAFLGNGGGCAQRQADYSLTVPSTSTARIQETHALMGHILCDLVERSVCDE